MLYFLALFCLSTSPNWAKLNQMSAEVLGFWRMGLAGLILLLLISFYKKRLRELKPNAYFIWILFAGVFFFLHLWTYKYAAKHTLVSNTMTLFATNPLWATAGSILFFKEKIKPRFVLAYILAILGIYILFSHNLEFSPENAMGNTMALVSAFFYAVFILFSKKVREKISNMVFATYQYTLTGIFFLIVCLVQQENLLAGSSPRSWLAVAGLILLPTFLGHFLMTHLVKTMNVAFLTCGKLIEPILASIMAYFIFGERLGTSIYISFVFTASAVVILFWPQISPYFTKRKLNL